MSFRQNFLLILILRKLRRIKNSGRQANFYMAKPVQFAGF